VGFYAAFFTAFLACFTDTTRLMASSSSFPFSAAISLSITSGELLRRGDLHAGHPLLELDRPSAEVDREEETAIRGRSRPGAHALLLGDHVAVFSLARPQRQRERHVLR